MPTLFQKNDEQPESNVAGLIKTPEQKPDDTATVIMEKLNKSVESAKINLPTMVEKAIKCELALSKILVINNDTDDAAAEKLLVRNRETYNEIFAMRESITKPIDEIKELAMRPEKRISILVNQPNSTFNRVKALRDTYANEKLKKQQAEAAKAAAEKAEAEEIIRLKGEFETTFYNNVVDALATMESNITTFFAALTVENFAEKEKRFGLKPSIKKEVFESWFNIPYDNKKLSAEKYNELVDRVRKVEAFTYDVVNADYVLRAEAKLAEWKAKLPAKKQELIELSELEKKNADEAETRRKEIAEKELADQKAREAANSQAKEENSNAVAVAAKNEVLEAEFNHLKVTQGQAPLKGVIKKNTAMLDCEPKRVVEVISKIIYTLFTVPVSNPVFHLKKDKSGVILPQDANGRPQYDEWLESLLTKFAATGVTLEGVKIIESVGTVQKAGK